MTEIHYKHAPIVDAVIDFVVDFAGAPPRQDDLRNFAASLSSTFRPATPVHELSVGVHQESADNIQSTVGQQAAGFRLDSADSTRVLLLRASGIALGHQPPYTSWAQFVSDARTYWELYRAQFSPKSIRRHAVRYINRIVLPDNRADPERYFQIYPQIPKGFPQFVNGMFMQLSIPQEDLGTNVLAVVNFALTVPDNDKSMAFMLDIDLANTVELDANSHDVWSSMEVLRARKNKLFEEAITDETRRLFQ